MRTDNIKEWIGAHDNQNIPPRVKERVLNRAGGICPKCTRKLIPGQWACDHIVALVNGGQHRESNLQPLCVTPCHSEKTKADVAEKRVVARKRVKHLGLQTAKRKIQSAGFRKAPPQNSATRPIEKRAAS